jgi:hypothetical protein
MISAKDLSSEQIETVTSWATAGDQLPAIQGKLRTEFGLNATYMDTRFLVLDLGIELVSEEDEEEAADAPDAAAVLEKAAAAGDGTVSVELDSVTRPGAMVSGRITFSDGEKGAWFIDQMGRPGLDTDTPGYRPTEEDLIEFEKKLRELMAEG